MTIYNKPTKPINYRKLYESVHGPIPKDELGRTYHIHHIDGNRQNNDISNLVALSLQDHYDVHYSQGDWIACTRLGHLLKMDSQQISELYSKSAKEQVLNGTHHLLGGEIQRKSNNARVAAGTHPFVKTWTCEYCGKNGEGASNYSRYHGEKCTKHPDPIIREQNILNKFNANSEESIKKGIETKKVNGTYGLSKPEGVAKAMESRRKNGTLKTNTPESIAKTKATKIKNGTLGRTESSIHAQKETLTRNAKQCPHCGKTVPGNGLFTRWHGNNCKSKTPV